MKIEDPSAARRPIDLKRPRDTICRGANQMMTNKNLSCNLGIEFAHRRQKPVSGPLPVSGRITPVIRGSGIRQSTPRGLFPDSHTHSRLHVFSLVLSRSHPDPHITSREQSVSGPLPVSGRIAPVIRGSGIRQSTPRGLFPDSHTHSRLRVCLTLSPCQSTAFLSDIYSSCTRSSSRRAC